LLNNPIRQDVYYQRRDRHILLARQNKNISLENIPQKLEYKMMVGYKQYTQPSFGIFINYLSKILNL